MKIFFAFVFGIISFYSNAQTVAFAADKMNVLYIGVDNPITIVAENTDCSKLKIKTNNVTLSGKDCRYVAKVENPGTASITVTYKVNGKTKYTTGTFRVKYPTPAIFKLGDGKRKMELAVLKTQKYVRADLEGFDYDPGIVIDSFTVCAFAKDTCVFNEVKNFGNKITDKVKGLFDKLKIGDTVIFKNIYARRPNEDGFYIECYVEPALVIVY